MALLEQSYLSIQFTLLGRVSTPKNPHHFSYYLDSRYPPQTNQRRPTMGHENCTRDNAIDRESFGKFWQD